MVVSIKFMKGFLKSILNVSLILSFLFLSSCGGKKSGKNGNDDIHYLRSPEWVQNAANDDCFSAVGISDKKGDLAKVQKYAKENAADSLKSNIVVKIEKMFFDEQTELPEDRRIKLIMEFNDVIKSKIKTTYLADISQVSDTWRSPDSSVLYVRIAANEKRVAHAVADALDELRKKYKSNNDALCLINNVRNDVLYNDFKVRNKRSKNKKEIDFDDEKNSSVVIKNIVISKSNEKLLNNSTESWTANDDEIDKEIRKTIEIAEKAEKIETNNE